MEKVWELFASATNLQHITPAHLNFRIISKHHEEEIYCGQIIEYRVSPLFGIPLYWMTEITHVEPGKSFIDEQRKGPYRMWQHQHRFKEIDGGVEMTDLVHYRLPASIIGRWMNTWMVRYKLREIFLFRFQKVEEIFGKWPGQEPAITIN